MYTQFITPTENPVRFDVPKEIFGHRLKVTVDDLDAAQDIKDGKAMEDAIAFLRNQQTDLSGYKFNREEANERRFTDVEDVFAHFRAIQIDTRRFRFDRDEANER